MAEPRTWRQWTVSLPLLVLVTASFFVGALATLPVPARAGPCDQVGGVVTGDWTISTPQSCTGIFYTVDGSVTVNSGGSLTLSNGGLRFSKDAAHSGYSLTVNAGGELILDNSTVTTETDAIAPYLHLALTVSGAGSHLAMRNGAVLKFPGWFNATGATLDFTDSTITGHAPASLLGLGVYADNNDDSPVINWASTTASLYRSRIERVYENTSAAGDPNATGIIEGNVLVRSGSSLYAYDSYIGVDYSNVRGLHNELQVDATSNAYLYAGTIDRTQDPVSMVNWQPAYVPLAAGGTVYLLRWLHVTVLDSTSFPVSGAMIASTLSPSATTAQFPDAGFGTVPTARTLAYLGRTAGGATAWNRTDATGTASIPLYTDQITTATLPNAESFGNYRQDTTYPGASATTGVGFDAYPAIAEPENNAFVTVPFPITVRTGADLVLNPADFPPRSVTQGQAFTVAAPVYNQGQTDASNVFVAAYLNGNEVGRTPTAVSILQGSSITVSVPVSGVGLTGQQTLMLVADPDNNVPEGGAAQEANNYVNMTLNVSPPPAGYVAILSPPQGQVVDPGTALSVSGYLRDQNTSGIVGVPVTIELRSGATIFASNLTVSQAEGFFLGTINVPATISDGPYTILITPASAPITPASQSIEIRKSVGFLNQSLIGLPVWIWLIVIVGAAAAIGGGTAYAKFVGLGKLVECGECGSYIRGDSTKCPKCGVEFEKGMAKCSNCQTWIPVAVKQCPECGVEFATGEVEMADYEAQMRAQYEQVRRRFRDEAGRELGHTLSDREFADWWQRQPTFVTFEDWLREEEEMRRLGSKACPVCSTLNSVTATVCHKCGTLLREERRVRAAPAPRPTRSEAPTEPVPPKTVKKTVVSGPVVQKKVVPSDADSQAGAQSGSTNTETQTEDSSGDQI